MEILMARTSHDQLGDTSKKTGFGWRSSQPPTRFSRMLVPRLPLHRPRAVTVL